MRRISITPAVIRHLASLPKMQEEFPFIRYASKTLKDKEKRSCCGNKARRSKRDTERVFETVKASIAHLPSDRIRLVKQLLDADELIIVLSVNGKKKTHTR